MVDNSLVKAATQAPFDASQGDSSLAVSELWRIPLVVSTTVVQLSLHQAELFADYLQEQNLAELLAARQVVDVDLLRAPTITNCFLDLSLVLQLAPVTWFWFAERFCPLLAGCRIVLRKETALAPLLAEYEGSVWEWNDQGYAVIVGSALELSVALDLLACPHLLQLELLGAGYHEIGVTDWRPPSRKAKKRKGIAS